MKFLFSFRKTIFNSHKITVGADISYKDIQPVQQCITFDLSLFPFSKFHSIRKPISMIPTNQHHY